MTQVITAITIIDYHGLTGDQIFTINLREIGTEQASWTHKTLPHISYARGPCIRRSRRNKA